MAKVSNLPVVFWVMLAWIVVTPRLQFFPGVLVKASLTKPDRVSLRDNGYSGVVVAIHEDVPENEELVTEIKTIFTVASAYIYNATRRRAFFRNITIIVPETWTRRSHYRVPDFYEHDVIIASPNRHWAPDPYTSQYQGCGEQGVGTRIGVEFVMDPQVEEFYGPLGRLLVHEWGHYRWGLFDEHPSVNTEPNTNQEEFYFSSITNTFHGISCSSSFSSKALKFDPDTGKYWACAGNDTVGYEEGCAHVTVDNSAMTNSTGSIMYSRQFYDKIVNFCDANDSYSENLHDRESPSTHNRLCASLSCWQIMQHHRDFKDGLNPPRDVETAELVPDFHITQGRARRLVLLIDTSRSMRYDNRFERLLSAAAHFIQSVAENGSHVGIVHFNQAAHVCSWLVQIQSQEDRDILLSSLPEVSDISGSHYGLGLLSSLQVLSLNESDSPAGGVILMFADGSDAGSVVTQQALQLIVSNSVRVDTVACTPNPKTFPAIATKTGGRSYNIQAREMSLLPVLYHAFADAMIRGQADSDRHRRTMVSSFTKTLNANMEWSSSFILDESIGRKTEIVLTWIDRNTIDIEVNLTSPSGETISNSTYPGYQFMTEFKLVIISVQNTAEVGEWELRMRNLAPARVSITCLVTSYARSDDVEPVIVTPMLSSYEIDASSGEQLRIYTAIRQGLRPVIGARVMASIYRPGGYPQIDLPLFDNGAGADTIQNDGVYSRYYVNQADAQGFNTIQITVMSNENTTVLNRTSQPRAVPNLPPSKYAEYPQIGGFPIFPPNSQQGYPVGNKVTNLRRLASGFTSYYDNFPSSPSNVTPPCRVHDLHVNDVTKLEDEGTIVLSWTAPGNDADMGSAYLYDIRFAQNVSTLVDNFEDAPSITDLEIIQGNLTTPQPAMSKEVFIIRVPLNQLKMTSCMTFALRAADGGNRFGVISNVARATFRTFIPPSAPPEPSMSISVTPTQTEPKTAPTTGGAITPSCPTSTGSSTQPGINLGKPTVDTCHIPKGEERSVLEWYEILLIAVCGSGVFVSVGCFCRKIYGKNPSARDVHRRWGDIPKLRGKTSARLKPSAHVVIADIEDSF
ncbi:calcium-activated chloride channel regulator 4-like [Asterias rubens]|uniref:calcium-activated chloride channel regulator 4-like n=1 Tax=Asterias rubens TaxID=7604 RepID=UPI001455B8F1|nr:calcium-activated chloride channel regulator 4-like [Asterias rubens]